MDAADVLPLAAEEMARRLSEPQDRRADWRLGVRSVTPREGNHGVELLFLVEVVPAPGRAVQTWEVTIPFDEPGLGGPTPGPGESLDGIVDTFVFVLRANLEEWWNVKGREPGWAAAGRRIS